MIANGNPKGVVKNLGLIGRGNTLELS